MCFTRWAGAASGQAMAEPAITMMKSRRRIAFPKARPTPTMLSDGRLQQGFVTREMGVRCQFAVQKFRVVDVAFGSSTDKIRCPPHVCFAPDSGLTPDKLHCQSKRAGRYV
jgi:hypothetical protein